MECFIFSSDKQSADRQTEYIISVRKLSDWWVSSTEKGSFNLEKGKHTRFPGWVIIIRKERKIIIILVHISPPNTQQYSSGQVDCLSGWWSLVHNQWKTPYYRYPLYCIQSEPTEKLDRSSVHWSRRTHGPTLKLTSYLIKHCTKAITIVMQPFCLVLSLFGFPFDVCVLVCLFVSWNPFSNKKKERLPV